MSGLTEDSCFYFECTTIFVLFEVYKKISGTLKGFQELPRVSRQDLEPGSINIPIHIS